LVNRHQLEVIDYLQEENRVLKERWMTQITRNVTDVSEGFVRGGRSLILDRDTKYTEEFRNILVCDSIRLVRLPPRSPNLNAFAERFVRSIKSECLNRMIFLGPSSLRRSHVHRHQRLGGMLNYYHRAAA
jgi:transposase InsO family protein